MALTDGRFGFERDYDYRESEGLIYFETTLKNREEGQIIHQNRIPLYPLTRKELLPLLEKSGFEIENLYGDAKGGDFKELSSMPLMVEAIMK